MTRKLGLLAVLTLLVAVFAVGCGDDSDDNSGNDAPAATTTAATDDAATDDAATEEDAPDTGIDDASLDQAVEACKSSVDSNPQVSADLKDDLKEVCDSVKSADPEEMKRVTREVCEKIVEGSVPEGDVREQALQACASAGG